MSSVCEISHSLPTTRVSSLSCSTRFLHSHTDAIRIHHFGLKRLLSTCFQQRKMHENTRLRCAVYVASFTRFLFYPTWIWVKVSWTVWQLDTRRLVVSGSSQLWGPTWRMSVPTGAEVEFHVCNYGTTGCRRTIWVRREKQVGAKKKGDKQFIKDFQLNPH